MVTSLVPTATVMAIDSATAGTLGVVAVVTLIVILAAREFITARIERRARGPTVRSGSGALNAPIIALIFVFVVILVTRVWAVLS